MRIIDEFLKLIAPHYCLCCSRPGELLCAGCKESVFIPIPSRCYLCKKITSAHAVCPKCRKKTPLSIVWVGAEYDEIAKQLIARLKFHRAVSVAGIIGDTLHGTLPILPREYILTHVPTATSRRRARGYDQAELIAKSLSRKSGLTHISLLARYGQSRQVGASRQQRTSQLKGAFRPLRRQHIKGRNIIIVDDILTTGATIEEAARALKKAGAKTVSAAVFSQKVL